MYIAGCRLVKCLLINEAKKSNTIGNITRIEPPYNGNYFVGNEASKFKVKVELADSPIPVEDGVIYANSVFDIERFIRNIIIPY